MSDILIIDNAQVKRRYVSERLRLEHARREVEGAEVKVIQIAETVIVPEQAEEKEGDSQDKNTYFSKPVSDAKGSVHVPSLNSSPANCSPFGKFAFETPRASAAALTGRSEGAGERAVPFHRSGARMVRRHSAEAMKVPNLTVKVKESEAKELEQGQGHVRRLILVAQRNLGIDKGKKSDHSVRFLIQSTCTF